MPVSALILDIIPLSLHGFRWFFAQKSGGDLFARSGRDDPPALGFQFFEVILHPGEDGVHITGAFTRMFFANAVNIIKNFVDFHHSPFSRSTGEQITGHFIPHAVYAC